MQKFGNRTAQDIARPSKERMIVLVAFERDIYDEAAEENFDGDPEAAIPQQLRMELQEACDKGFVDGNFQILKVSPNTEFDFDKLAKLNAAEGR